MRDLLPRNAEVENCGLYSTNLEVLLCDNRKLISIDSVKKTSDTEKYVRITKIRAVKIFRIGFGLTIFIVIGLS